MECQRCSQGKALYRVHTDAMSLTVCISCAEEARSLKLPVQDTDTTELWQTTQRPWAQPRRIKQKITLPLS